MVELMVGTMAPRQQQLDHELRQDYLGNVAFGGGGGESKSIPGQGAGARLPVGFEEKGWGGGAGWMGRGDTTSTTGKCVLWCAIGLGALVRGAPVDYVRW